MTNNVSLDEIGQRWGALLSQAMAQIITLEKQLATLQAEIARLNEIIENNGASTLSPPAKEIAERAVPRPAKW